MEVITWATRKQIIILLELFELSPVLPSPGEKKSLSRQNTRQENKNPPQDNFFFFFTNWGARCMGGSSDPALDKCAPRKILFHFFFSSQNHRFCLWMSTLASWIISCTDSGEKQTERNPFSGKKRKSTKQWARRKTKRCCSLNISTRKSAEE